MTIQQCKYVLEVLKKGSFNEAAKSMFTAQSSISASIKSLENELNIKIFERSNRGIFITSDGAEFVKYASHIVAQNDLILENYKVAKAFMKLNIATQHYDFVADVFTKMINTIDDDTYKILLKETKTYDVIKEVQNGQCDIGILAIKNTDYDIMHRFLGNIRIDFNFILKAMPHVYVKKTHPLTMLKSISYADLRDFPFVSYEQGKHGFSFFSEEIMEESYISKHIEINDRASLMNVLLTTKCYTIGTGIMPSTLNNKKIVSIPLKSDIYYNIGYILHKDRYLTEPTKQFIKMLKDEFQNI